MCDRIDNFRTGIRNWLRATHPDINSKSNVIGMKRMIEGLVARGYEVMLFHQGLGETCIFTMLVHAYVARRGRPLMLLTLSDARAQILEQCPYIEGAISCEVDIFHAIAVDMEFRERFQIKNFLELHYMSYQASNFKEEVCCYFNLPFDTAFQRYELKSYSYSKVRQFFDILKLQTGRTVLLVPFALCYGNEVCSKEFWIKLSDELKRRHFFPVFNAAEEFVPGIPYVYFDMQHIPDFCRLCGNVVGVRTGFLDVVATFTDVMIQAIYPNEFCPCWEQNPDLKGGHQTHKEKAESAFQGFRISRMFERENVVEFIHGDDDEDIERIIKNM